MSDSQPPVAVEDQLPAKHSYAETVKELSAITHSYAFFVLITLTLLNLLNYVDRFIFAALIPYIKADTHYTDEQIGWVGSAFTWIYTICAPLFGYLGDRYRRGRLIALGITIWSLATAAAGMSKNFAQLLFSRSSVGIGEANYATIAPGLLSDFFSRARRGIAMSFFMAAIPIGTAIGYLIGGYCGDPVHLGWRHTLYLVGLPGLLTAAVLYTLREPKRGGMDEEEVQSSESETQNSKLKTQNSSEGRKWWKDYQTLAINRGYIFPCLGYAAMTFAVGALVFWSPEWLKSDKGISAQEANIVLGVCAVLGGSLGTLVGGIFGDWLRARVRGAYYLVCGVSALVAVVPTLIAIISSNPMVYQTAIFLSISIIFLGNGPVNTLLVNVVPAYLRTTALGLVVVIIHFLGDGISLSLVGSISTWIRKTVDSGAQLPDFLITLGHIFHFNPQTQTLTAALLIMPVAMVVGSMMYFLGFRSPEAKKT